MEMLREDRAVRKSLLPPLSFTFAFIYLSYYVFSRHGKGSLANLAFTLAFSGMSYEWTTYLYWRGRESVLSRPMHIFSGRQDQVE